jgi:hypothetical protein
MAKAARVEYACAMVTPAGNTSIDAEARRRTIAELAAGRPAQHFTPWRGGHRQIPVIELAQELLLYRVQNGRLIAELEQHLRGRGLSLEGLAAREATGEVQALLHGFLAAKAADPGGPILQELRRQAQQTEPLLISAEGVLVNGNRRLAAMRELLAEDPDRYRGFAVVSAAVLPADAGAQDIESVEAALQLAPETKLAYGWINRRLKLRRQLGELGLSRDEVADAWRLADPAQLERELGELALAEDYLAHYLGEPGGYSLVADAEGLVTGLARRLELLPQELRAPWRLAGFCMIAGRAAVAGPMDRHFPFADPAPEHMPAWALRRFAEEQELVSSAPDGSQALDGEALGRLEAVFADAGRSGDHARALFGLMERLRAEHLEEHSPARMMKILEKLHDTLRRLHPEKLSEDQRQRIRSELAAIQAQAAVLLAEPEPRAGLAGRVARLLGR